jgi:hypothetical protein
MIALLWNLLVGRICIHRWEILRSATVWNADVSDQWPVGWKYVLRCARCGGIRSKQL